MYLQLEQASLFCVIDNDIKLKTQNHFLFLFTFFSLSKQNTNHEEHISKQRTIYYFLFSISTFPLQNSKLHYFLLARTDVHSHNRYFFLRLVFFIITKLSTRQRTRWQCNKQFLPLSIINLSPAEVQFSGIHLKELHCNNIPIITIYCQQFFPNCWFKLYKSVFDFINLWL